MLFLKKKIALRSFIKLIADEVLKAPSYTYDDYLAMDPDSILSHKEFEEFIQNQSFLRLLLLYAILIDSKNRRQIKGSAKDIDKNFIQALVLSYQDIVVDQDEAQRLSDVFGSELDHLASYIESIPEKDISEKGFTPYACLYFTAKFTDPSEESVKNGVYIALINTQRKLMKGYFGKAIEKVKIVN
ncbi:MAG: hypothetical protein APF81_01560 [Desulfosporosinus sp. BRH_c37]|nr:MAG: hypothetical protein APF81_01560 [Desulfosporosinus sp. BRH_c37]